MESNSSDQSTNTRTLAQRERKREIDKLKQRTKRAENKLRLEKIEHDLSHLRETVSELLAHCRAALPLPPPESPDSKTLVASDADSAEGADGQRRLEAASASTEASARTGTISLKRKYRASPRSPGTARQPKRTTWTAASNVGSSSPSSTPSSHDTACTHINDGFASSLSTQVRVHPYANAPFVPPPPSPPRLSLSPDAVSRIVVDCRCGHPHDDQTKCIEFAGFSLLLGPARPDTDLRPYMPRSPPLAEVLLHSVSAHNPLSAIITHILRQYDLASLATHVGFFFLAYRLLRWRLYPSPENFNDVPPNMRPTPSQERLPHPFSRDFLPWPALREYMNSVQHADRRSTVQMFIESIVFDWPTGKDLMCRNAAGSYDLHPDFEETVGDARFWHLEGPYVKVFPELVQYTR